MNSKIFTTLLVVVLAAGIVFRIWFLRQYGPYELSPDGIKYMAIAKNLTEKGLFSIDGVNPTEEVGPGFPLLLYLCYLPVKNGPKAQHILGVVQVTLGSLALLLTYLIGRNFFSPWAGLIAMSILTFYQPLVFIQNYTLTESLYIFLVAISMYLLSIWDPGSSMRRQTWCISAGIGLCIALQALVRPPSLFFVTIPLGTALYKMHLGAARHRILQAYGLLLVVFCLTLTPWVIRNYLTFNKLIIVSSGSVDPLLFGAFPQREGYLNALKELHQQIQQLPQGSDVLAFSEQFAINQVKQQFQKDFGATLKWYTVQKFQLLWTRPYTPTPGLKFAEEETIIYHRWMCSLGALGILLQLLFVRSYSWYILCSHLVVISLIYQMYAVDSRYALPFMPLIALLVGSFCFLIFTWLRKALTSMDLPALSRGFS